MSKNPENQLTGITGTPSATFVYDGDGNRVKSTINTTTTAFIGNHTEWDVASNSLTRYYYAGSSRVAMRKNNTIYYLLSDHLGSTSLTTDENGQNPVAQLYFPWGEVRYSSGGLQTKYTYTGQYSNVTDFGLMYYNARWYDSLLGRFAQADTIVPQPGNPQDWDRYGYTKNNPINYSDPSGHMIDNGCNRSGCTGDPNAITHIIYMGGFPAVMLPNISSLGSRAEDTFDPESRPDPSALIQIGSDIAEQGLHYKYQHDPKDIHAFLKYEEKLDGSMSITSIEIWNRSNVNVSLGSVDITSNPMPCNELCITGPLYNYTVDPPRIGTSSAGLGVIAPNSRGKISLIPSGIKNPTNSFYQNRTINVAAVFNLYFPRFDNTAFFRMLQTEITW